MNVLLVSAYKDPRLTAGRYSSFLKSMPPISIAYVAAALEQAGIRVAFYDDQLAYGDRNRFFEAVKRFSPDVVGFSVVTPMAQGVNDLARALREFDPNIKIMMGNIHADIFGERLLSRGLADYIVHGEGEKTTPELVHALGARRDLGEVLGISFRTNGRVVNTGPRPFIDDLDSLPFPSWHLFPLKKYEIFNFASVRKPGALILGSRGCPYKCTFCCLKIMGDRRRKRSTANIASEAAWLCESFGYRQVSFTDPIFPLTKKEGLAFSQEMISRGLHRKLVWITETRVDLVDFELLQAMREAGLRRIMYGFESGSTSGLSAIKKHATLHAARNAVEVARKAGVQVIGFFMLGVPGETLQSMEETLSFSRSLDIDFAKFTVFSPFPGTKVYEEFLADGKIPDTEQWERYTNYPSRKNPPIYLPERLTLKDIIRYQRKALLLFYLRPRMLFRHFFRIRTLGIRDILGAVNAMMADS